MTKPELKVELQRVRVQSRVENRKTKDFHDWFYRFLDERIKEAI